MPAFEGNKPPEEVNAIIDKTAHFVAKLGQDFEKKILENEINNPKFSFLRVTDPFHSFYKKRVEDFLYELGLKKKEEPIVSTSSVPPGTVGVVTVEQQQIAKPVAFSLPARVQYVINQHKGREFEAPPPDQYILNIPGDMTAVDLDVIKLTAQFVAKNGHQFQVGLMNREHKNPQFDFLKPNHPHYQLFLNLVESYTRCILAPKNLVDKLANEFNDKLVILDRLIARHEYNVKVENERREREKQEEQEKMANAMIDWHDFVIVETITFDDDEMSMSETQPPGGLSAKSMVEQQHQIMQKQREEIEMDTEDMEMEVEPEPSSKPLGEIKVKKDYVKPLQRVQPGVKYQICPKCGQQIPVDQMADHMRIELLDPKYAQQRAAALDKTKSTSTATDQEIGRNLASFAKRRTDIFGAEGEVEIGKTVGEEGSAQRKTEEKVIWDGHSGSISRATALGGKSVEEQIAAIHAMKSQRQVEEPKPGEPAAALPPHLAPPPPPGSMQHTMPKPVPPPLGGMRPPMPPPPGILGLPPGLGAPMGHPPGLGSPMSQPGMSSPMSQPGMSSPMSQPGMSSPMSQPGMSSPMSQPGMSPQTHGMPPSMGMASSMSQPSTVGSPMAPPGMGTTPMGGPPGMRPHVAYPPPGVAPPAHPGPLEEPIPKRQKTEEAVPLIPEQEFLAKHSGPVTIQVLCPKDAENPKWKLEGQTVSIQLALTDTIAVVKDKLKELLGMPPNKQKLKTTSNPILKDQLTLAYYNLADGATLQLNVKTRGGK